jgi:23S rRNA (adenine2503-C2)-methyltransferase
VQTPPRTSTRPSDAGPAAAGPPPVNLYGLDRQELASVLAPLTDRRFHADQVYHWMYGRQATSFEAMTDLPAGLRRDLAARHAIAWPQETSAGRSSDGSVKYVLRLEDGREIEAVHIVYGERITFCLSSQVGCALQCGFCLTATMGLLRNLTPGEILGQVSALARAGSVDLKTLRIVFMGMGEPLHNYDAVLKAFRILVDPLGFSLQPRRVTLSTVGLVPGIERLAHEDPRPRLAVSLTAATDALRDRLVPINRKHDLASLVRSCRAFPLRPRERITFEYILLQGINDGQRDADGVARLLHGVRAKVNVIPYNDTGLEGFRTPPAAVAARFRDTLLARGVPASIRWSKGRDIGAACGQLARGPETADRVPG